LDSWTSDSEAGVKTVKSGGVPGGEGECRDDVAGLLVRKRDGVWIRKTTSPKTEIQTVSQNNIIARTNYDCTYSKFKFSRPALGLYCIGY